MQRGTQLRLVMRRGPQVDRAFPLAKDVVTIGRDAANDIVIADPEVSRHHSRLVLQPNGAVTIEDLGSTNGTYVNGIRLAGPQALVPGDTVGLGETVALQYQVAAGDAGVTIAAPRGAFPAEGAPPLYPPVSTPEPGYAPPAREEFAPPPPPAPGRAQIYPQAGARPPQVPVEAPPRRSSAGMRNVLLGGCGCLLLLCVLCVVAVWLGDTFGGAEFWLVPPMSWILDLVRALGLQSLFGAG